MSDAATSTETSNMDGNQTSEPTSTAGDEFKPITSQDDLNKLIADRVQRERAKYADYKDVKAKAAEYDKVAGANKSEIDKAMDRVTKAEAEVAAVPTKVADALRTHLIALHEINADDAELFLTATDPELLLKQVSRLMARESDRAAELQQQEADRKKKNPSVPKEGTSTKPGTTTEEDDRAFARTFFGRGAS